MTETTARNERRARRRGGVETGSAPSRTGSYRRLVNPFTPLRVFSDDQVEATPTIGTAGGFDPSEPRKRWFEKAKMPPSDPTMR
jgi:hypothetical protein